MTYDPTEPVQHGDALAGAVLSGDRRYRYVLWRSWDPGQSGLPVPVPTLGAPFVMFIGLNPSVATHTRDDATVRRWRGFAKAWGFGGFFAVEPVRAVLDRA